MAPNVRHLIAEFNRISMWVAYQICREPDLKQRTAIMAFLIDVGWRGKRTRACVYVCVWAALDGHACGAALGLGNYNAAMEVVAALATSPCRRLKKTFAALPSKHESRLARMRDLLRSVPRNRVCMSA